jgi:tRNA(Ile)-lysidine synthase
MVAARPAARRVVGRWNTEVFDADKVGSRILMRRWRPGDRFQPIGYPRAAKLQDLFVNQRIPREARHRLAVATTASGEIFWVEGLRMAEAFKLDKRSRRGLKWAWQGAKVPTKGLVARCPCPW